jgi:hypothetical protein
MCEYLQFAVMDLCCEIERTTDEYAFLIPNPLFEIEKKKILNKI